MVTTFLLGAISFLACAINAFDRPLLRPTRFTAFRSPLRVVRGGAIAMSSTANALTEQTCSAPTSFGELDLSGSGVCRLPDLL